MAEQLPLKFEFRADHTFEDYFPGNNIEVVDLLKKFANGEGEKFIFLWGNSGYGKSHLLNACCQRAFQKGLSSFYLDFTEFDLTDTDLFVGLENFELVCLDNINRLSGREDWEIALFNFYNQHRDLQRRLLISASAAPDSLSFTLPDLKTRFNWGLTLKINPFDDTNKIAALSYKAHQKGFEIPLQTARYLLSRYDRKLSSLWTILDKLDVASLAAKRKLTIPFLKEIMDQEEFLD
jgi:DnaA-homolog protein